MPKVIRGIVAHIFMKFCILFPIEDKIVFMSFYGKSFGDSPKSIYNQLVKTNIKTKVIWILDDNKIQIPGAEVIKSSSFRAIYHLATAKIWIDNSRKRWWIIKRKNQYYIQTWHAGITMKKVEKDAINSLSQDYIKSAKHDSEMADLFISGSKWNTENYRQSFWYNGEILESGLPRSDIFFTKNGSDKIREQYNVTDKEKIALYAPTFRVDGNTKCYNMDFQSVIRTLEKKWGGTWKILVKFHPNILTKKEELKYSNNVIDASLHSDINELILVSDVLITDYSSCMFDAMNIGKTIILYATDIDEYYKDRGTYFSFEELPFPLATTNKELVDIILDFDNNKYKNTVKYFLEQHKIFDDGHASEKIVERICDILRVK